MVGVEGQMPGGARAGSGGAYDRLAYPGFAYAATHPARLQALGMLFGLDPAPAHACRVLELGCGDGGNALSIAQALPEAEVVGIDASPAAIERGTKLASDAGIENVQLRCATFEELGEEREGFSDVGTPHGGGPPEGRRQAGEPGEPQSARGPAGAPEAAGFDYILSHGVYSWVPPPARAALLDCARRCLAPQGIAFVSYNAYPGSYLRDMARDILAYHVRDIEDPQRKLAAAQELMHTIVAIEEPSPFARVLREHMDRMLGYSDALLFHDDLAEVSTPFYFHEFVEHAERHGLRFLSEAELSESQMRDVPASAGQLMASLPEDAVVREQYLDFFKNRMFRQTLLCHAQVPVSRALDDREIERLWISSSAHPQEPGSDLGDARRAPGDMGSGGDAVSEAEPVAQAEGKTFATPEGYTVTTSEPLVAAAVRALAAAWPQAMSFAELLDRALEDPGLDASRDEAAARLREVLLQAYLARIVQLLGCPPPVAASPSERPRASALTRAQHAAGSVALSSLLHANARLEGEIEPRLLPLLDGTRDRAELAHALNASEQQLDESLARLASLGLLARG